MSLQRTHQNHQFPKHLKAFSFPFLLLNYGMQLQNCAFYFIPLLEEKETNLWTTLRSIAVFANSDLYEFKADCGYLRGLTENNSVIRVKTRKIRGFRDFYEVIPLLHMYKSSVTNHIYMH